MHHACYGWPQALIIEDHRPPRRLLHILLIFRSDARPPSRHRDFVLLLILLAYMNRCLTVSYDTSDFSPNPVLKTRTMNPAKMGVYPQVPRSSQTQINDSTPQQPAPSSRFSWVATPAEAKAHTWHRNGINESSEMPPLPQVPEYLHHHSTLPPINTNTVRRTEQQPAQPTEQPYQPSVPQQPAPAYTQSEYPPAEHFTSGLTSHPAQPDQTYLQHPQPPSEPLHLHERQYSQDSKPTNTMQYTQMPPPTNQPDSPTTKPALPIAPDENPLDATSPTHSIPRSAFPPNTTNIPILRPTQTTTTFTPTSQTPGPIHGGSWHHSLFSCLPLSTCLVGLSCPCIIYGRTQYRLTQRSAHKDPTNMLGYRACNGSCVAFALLCGVNLGLAAIQKTRVRKAYAMDKAAAGGLGSDFAAGVGCCCCSVAQDEKEVAWREEVGRRGGGGLEAGYKPVGGMRFEPPPGR